MIRRLQSRQEILRRHLDSLSLGKLLGLRPDHCAIRFGRRTQVKGEPEYNPAQLRDERGRWTDAYVATSDERAVSQISARPMSPAREAECEELRRSDEIQCRFVGLRACWAQAALRYANCRAGLPIPPLNY